jgi:molybdopterin/thiamine biosynthesis adenylyltransferase
MASLVQVGAGSGGMAVLDLVCQDRRITRVSLVEPDVYKPHNVARHVFPVVTVGQPKALLAKRWLEERRPDLEVGVICANLMEPAAQREIEAACAGADLGICALDNESGKYAWDALMRRHAKPWTLGEVLSGGIGGFVHWFVPGGPCYGCVASFLQRSVTVAKEKAPDYSQAGGPVPEATIPATKASIQAIASLHALVTLGLLGAGSGYDPGFTSMLMTLERVPEVFEEAFRPHRFRVSRLPECLICGSRGPAAADAFSREELDDVLDRALARLGDS